MIHISTDGTIEIRRAQVNDNEDPADCSLVTLELFGWDKGADCVNTHLIGETGSRAEQLRRLSPIIQRALDSVEYDDDDRSYMYWTRLRHRIESTWFNEHEAYNEALAQILILTMRELLAISPAFTGGIEDWQLVEPADDPFCDNLPPHPAESARPT